MEGPRLGVQIEEGAPTPEVAVSVGEGGTVLSEVAVEGGREALEGHVESAVQ